MEYYLAIIITMVLISFILFYQIIQNLNLKFIHSISFALIIGLNLGIIAYIKNENIIFNENLFFYLILPIIIMNAAKNIKLDKMIENKYLILFFGLIGTLLSFILMFLFIIMFKKIGYIIEIDYHNALILAAALSATDSISILSIISEEKFPSVYSIIFGESIINDAVAIVLFKTSVYHYNLFSNNNSILLSLGKLLLKFFTIFIFSILLGIIFGLLLIIIFRKIRTFNSNQKISLYFLFGLLCFSIAELFNISGILSLIIFIIISDYYINKIENFKNNTNKIVGYILEPLSYLSEYFCTIYLGICGIIIIINSYKNDSLNFTFSLSILISLFIVRWIIVGFPIILYNLYREVNLNYRDIILIWYSGLIKGSISFGLAFSINLKNLQDFKIIVLIIVLLTSIFLSSFTNYLIDIWGFCLKEKNSIFDNRKNFLDNLVFNKSINLLDNDSYSTKIKDSMLSIDNKITKNLIK